MRFSRVVRAALSHFAALHSEPPSSGDGGPPRKTAPWEKWKRLPLRASAGTAEYPVAFTVEGPDPEQNKRYSTLITQAARDHFKIEHPPPEHASPAAYLVGARTLRVLYDELIVQFKPHVNPVRCDAILEQTGFQRLEPSEFAKNRWTVRHAHGATGQALLVAAHVLEEFEEVEFAWPNSVAEYHRAAGVATPQQRWPLDKIKVNWSTGTRRLVRGDPDIVIAVIDDGVDINHPNLLGRVAPGLGRDFCFPTGDPRHFDPGPKTQVVDGDSDYHGTFCAGLICSDGKQKKFLGVAPRCALLGVRVFDGPNLILEESLAAAIDYAKDHAHVISCSWFVEDEHPSVVQALEDTRLGRGGKGSVLVCAAGNAFGGAVDFPARHSRAIAVGACGPNYEVTTYANTGPRLDVVAPSSLSLGTPEVYSTDVATPTLPGFNPGSTGDSAGLFTIQVGKTSAATAIVAGVAALCLSVNSNLTAAEVRSVLQATADEVGNVTYTAGHSDEFGHGCIDAALALGVAKALLMGVPLP